MRRYRLALLIMLCASVPMAAQADKYRVTAAEKLACLTDAEQLCMAAYPDEDKPIGCMRTNRARLSAECGEAFDAGMKRRGLR